MEQRILQNIDGRYSANIDITVDEWKEMLMNESIFTDDSLKMIEHWYVQKDFSATHKEIMTQFNITLKATPFNGIVKGLGQRILKHLNRFEILDTGGSGNSYFIVPFEGWHKDYKRSGDFVWKLRKELVQAIKELDLFGDTPLGSDIDFENIGFQEKREEGTVTVSYTKKFIRDRINRIRAINFHGTTCCICGFNFEKAYGKRGEGFIEVHHIKPLYENQKEVKVNPAKDLICVCSNCHRMFHRKKNKVPTPDELKTELRKKNFENIFPEK